MCEGHGESEMAEFLDLVLVKSHLNFLMFFFYADICLFYC